MGNANIFKFLPQDHLELKRMVKSSDRQPAIISSTTKSMGHYDAAEALYKIIEEKVSDKKEFLIDQLAPSAVILYLTALECYMNEHLGRSFEFLVHSSATLSNFSHLPQSENEIAIHIEKIRSKGLSDKLSMFCDFYNISDFKNSDIYKNIKALAGFRHEIIHYFPYMMDNNYCRVRIKKVLDIMNIEFDSRLRWSYYLADFRILKWCKENVKIFSLEMEKIGFEPIDRKSFMEKLEQQIDLSKN